jgi:spore coat protein CotH
MLRWIAVAALAVLGATPVLWSQKTTAPPEDIYALDRILRIEVDFKEPDWHKRLDSLKEGGYETRLTADVKINGKLYAGAGIRYKGNSSYFNVRNSGYQKLPFNIKVNHSTKNLRLPGGYTTLKLSNVFRDPSFLREVLAYEIAGLYMSAPRANFAKVYVEGEYLGVYNLSESIDDDLIEKFFGNDKGVLVKCDPFWHEERITGCLEGDKSNLQYLGPDSICYRALYEPKEKGSWRALIEFTRIMSREPQRLPSILNIDETLWMLAFDNVIVNLDSYIGQLCHNYYMYRDTFGIWRPIVWDMNLSFGGFRRTGIGAPLTNEKMAELSPFLHFTERNEKRPLIMRLLENDHYRRIYLAHMRTIVDENFANGRYLERARAIQAIIAPEVAADSNRLYNMEAFRQNLSQTVVVDNTSIVGIEELMSRRVTYLLSHPALSKEGPALEKPTALKLGSTVAISAKATGATKMTLYYRYGQYTPWKQAELKDDGGHQDEMAEDGIWGAEIPDGKDIQYYIVAENQYIATVSPRRASKEFYSVP